MISKVERGETPPSLTTLQALAHALSVPVTALFRRYEEQRDASFVPAGAGLDRPPRNAHRPPLRAARPHGRQARLGRAVPDLARPRESEVFPHFQHAGVELIYMLEGEVIYRAAGSTYRLRPGDALMFDADAAHGPEELL